MKKIVEATQTDDFLVCYHNCGNCTVQQIESITQNGCRVLHFGNAIDMADMMPKVPENIIAMGNLDPAGLFRNGTPETVKAATVELMEKCRILPELRTVFPDAISRLFPDGTTLWRSLTVVNEFYAKNN